MQTVKTFRKLGQDEEGHSTSFETHKYPGDLGTGQLTLGPGCGGSRGREETRALQVPASCSLPPIVEGVPSSGYAVQHPAQLYRSLWASTAPAPVASPVLGR